MSLRYCIIIFFLLYAGIGAQEKKIRLSIKTNIRESYIYINNEFKGRGQIKLEVVKGDYIVHLKESLLRWTGSDMADTLKITGGEGDIEKTYSFIEYKRLESEPSDAHVLYSDSLLGHTPLFIPKNVKNITLLKDNYAPLNVNLKNQRKEEINLGTPINGTTNSFVKTVWYKALLGSAAVLGAVAAYSKIQADKKYDNYLVSGKASEMDEANRLDRISAFSLAALQINFAVLLYFLFAE